MKMGQYTEKLEEVTEQLFEVNDFRKKHGAVGRPLDELESAYERDMIVYGNLIMQEMKL